MNEESERKKIKCKFISIQNLSNVMRNDNRQPKSDYYFTTSSEKKSLRMVYEALLKSSLLNLDGQSYLGK